MSLGETRGFVDRPAYFSNAREVAQKPRASYSVSKNVPHMLMVRHVGTTAPRILAADGQQDQSSCGQAPSPARWSGRRASVDRTAESDASSRHGAATRLNSSTPSRAYEGMQHKIGACGVLQYCISKEKEQDPKAISCDPKQST